MGRFLSSKEDRQILYDHQDGKCALCGGPLGEHWHADHIIPWSRGGRTNVHAMQAVCPPCNLKKGAKMPNKEDNPLQLNCIDLSAARVCQREAFNAGYGRLMHDKEAYCSVVMATGSGKSDLYKMIAWYGRQMRHFCTTLVISPNDYLADQMVDKGKMAEFCSRYKVHGGPVRFKRIRGKGKYGTNGEFLLSTTIQLIHHRLEYFADWFHNKYVETGLPVLIVVDETHQYTKGNHWGKTIKRLMRSDLEPLNSEVDERVGNCAQCLVGTATAIREKGQSLVGFEHNVDTTSSKIRLDYKVSKDDPNKVTVSEWCVDKEYITISPDYYYGFRQARDDGVITGIQRHTFDVELKKTDLNVSSVEMLSQLSKSACRGLLGKIVRSQHVIEQGVEESVRILRQLRNSHPELQMIVFCAADQHNERPNKHAKQIRNVFSLVAPDLDVVIATSANEDASGSDVLEAFCRKDGRPSGDVLIVKQMAGVGLDNSRIKVSLDLSPVRAPVTCIQQDNRSSRIHLDITVCHLVTPKDILRDEVFSKFVDPDHEAVLEDSKLLRQWDIPREPQPSKPVYTVTGARSVDSGMDHDCNVVGPEDYARANRFIHICPVLATKFTHTQLAAMPSDQVDKLVLDELARAHSAAPSAEDNNGVPEDTGKSLDTLRSVANQWVKDIVNSLIRKRGGEYRTDSPTAHIFRIFRASSS
jgi:hypothetical protein